MYFSIAFLLKFKIWLLMSVNFIFSTLLYLSAFHNLNENYKIFL